MFSDGTLVFGTSTVSSHLPVAFGGSVYIPKVYNGKNKTFFEC